MLPEIMCKQFYKLNEEPFFDSIDSRYIYLNEDHLEAFSSLKYAGEHGKGFLMLTGGPGTGKTSIVRKFLNEVDDNLIVANLTNPNLDLIDFFNVLLDAFGLKKVIGTKREFWAVFKKFLNKAHKYRKNVLLIIDEAHELPSHLYEEIRLLTNVDTLGYNMINIFFVGQTELRDIILEPRNKSLRERIYINYNIEPLSEEDTKKFIIHRLRCAGADNNPFSMEALSAIFQYTKGYPRSIIDLCQRSLLKGSARSAKLIEKNLIDESANDINLGVIQPRRIKNNYEDKPSRSEYIAEEQEIFGLGAIISNFRNKIRLLEFGKIFGLKRWPLALATATMLLVLISVGVLFLGEDTTKESSILSNNEQIAIIAKNDTVAKNQRPSNPIDNTAQSKNRSEASQKTLFTKIDSVPKADESQNDNFLEEKKLNTFEQDSAVSLEKKEDEKEFNDKPIVVDSKIPQKNSLQTSIKKPDKADQTTSFTIIKPTAGNDKKEPKETIPLTSERGKFAEKQTTVDKKEPDIKKTLQRDKNQKQSTTDKADIVDKKGSDTNQTGLIDNSETRTILKKPEAATAMVLQKDDAHSSRNDIEQIQKTTNKPKKIAGGESRLHENQQINSPENLKIETAKVSEDQESTINMREKVIAFLDKYCITYESKQLGNFVSFFSNDAIENGKPLSSLIPKYRRNFEAVETIQYQISLEKFSHDKVNDTVTIEGIFSLKWKPYDYDWRKNTGKIFMDLQKSGDSFTVFNLTYYGTRSKN